MASQPCNDPRALANTEESLLSDSMASLSTLGTQPIASHDANSETPSQPQTPAALIHTEGLEPAAPRVLVGSQTTYDELRARSIGSSLFFKMLPLEMREEIYKCLLTSSVLGTQAAIDPAQDYGRTVKYNLSPKILRTCRTIHEEAEHILYEKNTFIISLLGNDRPLRSYKPVLMGIPCPLLRYLPKGDLAMTTGISKVKRWTIVASCWAGKVSCGHPPTVIIGFCREISSVPLESITFLLLDHRACIDSRTLGKKSDMKRPVPSVKRAPFGLAEVLSPFRLFHGLRNVEVSLVGTHANEPTVLEHVAELKTLLMSQAEVEPEHVFKMYANLLRYARAFERHPKFKNEMGPPHSLFQDNDQPNDQLAIVNWNPTKAEREDKKSAGHLHGVNPFKLSDPHPVERALKIAKFAMDDDNVDEFKKQRKIVLEYLEPHYQRIASFDPTVVSFLDKHRRKWGDKFLLKNAGLKAIMLEGTNLVKQYAKVFVRQLTGESKAISELHKDVIDGFYKNLDRESYIRETIKKSKTSSWRRWRDDFQRAVNEMDDQYMEMQAARKQLFQNDQAGTDVGCDIDMSFVGREQSLNWTPEE